MLPSRCTQDTDLGSVPMRLSRRTLLLSGAAVPLAACTDAPRPQPEPVDPDVALRDAAVAREQALLQEYDAALAAVPALAPVLAPLRADHLAHLASLSPTGSPAPLPSPAAAPRVLPTEAKARRAAVLARLAGAERTAATAHATAALEASAALCGLLGQLSASESSHPVVLA